MIMNAEEIENTLLAIIDCFEGQVPTERLQDMRELTTAGEPGIALENLCSNLDDYGVAITPDSLAKIREVGQAMGIGPDYWERLAVEGHQ